MVRPCASSRSDRRRSPTAPWSTNRGDAFAYHWVDADGRVVVRDGVRTQLPDVAPGDEVELRVRVDGPLRPGKHTLQLEPVREHAAWYGPSRPCG